MGSKKPRERTQEERTTERKAGALFNELAKRLEGIPGDIAMTAAVNLLVYGAKGVGVTLPQIQEIVKLTWERTETKRDGG